MRVTVTVRPNARRSRVEAGPGGTLRVAVAAPAREGRANAALIDLLAEYFDVSRSKIQILHGASSRHKVVEVRR
jgi:hypothetical protein